MKPVLFKTLLLAVTATFVAACSPTSDKLLPKPDYSKPAKKENLGEYFPFNPYVDILWVVDNSGSMGSHQANIGNNIDQFISGITQNTLLDFNIGAVSSDDAALFGTTKIVTKNTPNLKTVLKNNIMLGTYGSGYEVFLDIVDEALSPAYQAGANKGFYRQDALLAIVFLTDAEDQGTVSAQQLYQTLLNLKNGDPTRVAVYSVVIPPGENRCPRDSYDEPQKIIDFTNLFGGMVFNLCDSDFGQKLLQIGSDITKKTAMVIPLKQIPAPNTIKLTYGSQTIPNDLNAGWSYDPKRNAIILGKDLTLKDEPKGTQIEVYFVPADL